MCNLHAYWNLAVPHTEPWTDKYEGSKYLCCSICIKSFNNKCNAMNS